VCVSRQTFLDHAAGRLREAGIVEARQEARLMIEAVAGISLTHQLAFPDVLLTGDQLFSLDDALAKREARMPLSQIIEKAMFYDQAFTVTKETLTPRPESELLVDAAIACTDSLQSVRLLDAFTGTGAIGISIARSLHDAGKDVALMMTDNSRHAVDVARQNALRIIASVSWEIECSDIWPSIYCRYDVITANPPYIATDEIESLMPEVSRFEPLSALDGGRDGLDYFRRLSLEAGCYLCEGGVLIIEIGAYQEEDVARLFARDSAWRECDRIKDLAGHTRVIVFCMEAG
jgi:release factor glutamine methyltransferase